MSLIAIPSSILSSIIVIPLVVIITPVFSSALIMWAKRVVKKQNKNLDKDNFNVTFNKLAVSSITFLICFLTGIAILFVVLYFVAEDMPLEILIGTSVGFGSAAVVALIFQLLICRWRICVRGTSIIYVPMIGKKYENDLKNVSRVDTRASGPGAVRHIVFFKGSTKKAFVFNNLMVGANLLEQRLSENSGFRFLPNI